jgi:hypothetical protein
MYNKKQRRQRIFAPTEKNWAYIAIIGYLGTARAPPDAGKGAGFLFLCLRATGGKKTT